MSTILTINYFNGFDYIFRWMGNALSARLNGT